MGWFIIVSVNYGNVIYESLFEPGRQAKECSALPGRFTAPSQVRVFVFCFFGRSQKYFPSFAGSGELCSVSPLVFGQTAVVVFEIM